MDKLFTNEIAAQAQAMLNHIETAYALYGDHEDKAHIIKSYHDILTFIKENGKTKKDDEEEQKNVRALLQMLCHAALKADEMGVYIIAEYKP